MEELPYIPIYALAEWHFCPRSGYYSWLGAGRRDPVTGAYQQMREHHARANTAGRRYRAESNVDTAVSLVSARLGITGRADAVEVMDDGEVCPVEYKRHGETVPPHLLAQIALQALCLEEMRGISIVRGFLFDVDRKRRMEVPITRAARAAALRGLRAFRHALRQGITAFAKQRQPACAGCIYRPDCWPYEHPAL